MVLRQLRGTGPGVIALITFFLLVLWAGAFVRPATAAGLSGDLYAMPLYGLLSGLLLKIPYAGILFMVLLAGITAATLVNFNTTDFFMGERTFLPAFFYILMTGLFTRLHYLNPVLPASMFLLLAIMRINTSYRVEGVAYSFFDAGLLIGTGSLFYANLIWFIVVIFAGIAIYRNLNLRELITAIVGVLTPLVLTLAYYYLAGKDLKALADTALKNILLVPGKDIFSRAEVTILIVAGLTGLVTAGYLFMNMGSMKIRSRKTFYLLGWIFLATMGIYFLVPAVSVEIVWIVLFPFCYFMSFFFAGLRRKIVRETIFYIFLALVLLMQVLYLV